MNANEYEKYRAEKHRAESEKFNERLKWSEEMLAESFEKKFGISFKTVISYHEKTGNYLDTLDSHYYNRDNKEYKGYTEYIFSPYTGEWEGVLSLGMGN